MKPLCIDLFCFMQAYGKIMGNGNKIRQGKMGERVASAQEKRGISAREGRVPAKARPHEIARTPILAFHDDALYMERSRETRLDALSGQRNYRLHKMAGVFKLPGRHGSEAHFETYVGSNRFGWQL